MRPVSVGLNALIFILIVSLIGCSESEQKEMEVIEEPIPSVTHPEWTRNASIYEVNIRQYTPEGTINAFAERLKEIKALGVDIIWLMPIYPVGELNRKGTMGSGYSVRDYRDINPDMGTMDDLKKLVNKAHDMGMYVLLDWIANHTAWDNNLTLEHPEWYTKDSLGNFTPPVADWSDVIDLNYGQQGLRDYMTESLKYWITNANIDGFRCDMAHMVPTDFWDSARVELNAIKPVFMLAETENPDLLYRAFDMNYTWELFHIMEDIAKGTKNVQDIRSNLEKEAKKYGPDAYRMYFTTNHDENAWAGTAFERFGDGRETFSALTMTLPGMPLVYSGQEVGLNKRLPFFEKDTIDWKPSEFRALYQTLLHLKQDNQALWNGAQGGPLAELTTTKPNEVFAFTREKGEYKIIAIFNLSTSVLDIQIESDLEFNKFKDVFTNETTALKQGQSVHLEAWDYLILTN